MHVYRKLFDRFFFLRLLHSFLLILPSALHRSSLTCRLHTLVLAKPGSSCSHQMIPQSLAAVKPSRLVAISNGLPNEPKLDAFAHVVAEVHGLPLKISRCREYPYRSFTRPHNSSTEKVEKHDRAAHISFEEASTAPRPTSPSQTAHLHLPRQTTRPFSHLPSSDSQYTTPIDTSWLLFEPANKEVPAVDG